MPKLRRINALADALDVGLPRAYQLVRDGRIPRHVAVRIGRQIRVNPDALADWIAAGMPQPSEADR